MQLGLGSSIASLVSLVALGCGPDPAADEGGTGSTGATSSTVDPTPGTTVDPTIGPDDTTGTSAATESSDGTTEGSGDSTGQPPGGAETQAVPIVRLREVCEALDAGGDPRCCLASACDVDHAGAITCLTDRIQDAAIAAGDQPQVDVLFVIDDTLDTGPMERALAMRAPQLVEGLRGLQTGGGAGLDADVQIMFTTTDFGNPLCTPFQSHEPERGAPVDTACTDRLERFTSLSGTQVYEEACTDVCANGAAPTGGDAFLRFGPGTDNASAVGAYDIDGDGTDDDALTQAVACMLPQGLDGCGFESPLENMLQAMNPGAPWNSGPTPFVRPDATLAIVVMTNEADCSVQDYAIMDDPAFQNVDPNTGAAAPSSAICWNAGVQCDGPDALGVYSNCVAAPGGDLQATSRYTGYLVDQLHDVQGKEVVMLVIGGISEAGADATVIHDWEPADLDADDVAMGVTAADKQFEFGVGPGCGGAYP